MKVLIVVGWAVVAALTALWLYTTSLAAELAGASRAVGLVAAATVAAGLAWSAWVVFGGPKDKSGGREDRSGGWAERVNRAVRELSTGHRWALGVVVAVGVLLRLDALFQPIRHDEAYTYLVYGSRAVREALSSYSTPNNHLLNTLLVGGTARWLGDSEPLLRLPAFLSGTLLLPAVYAVGHGAWDRKTALLGTGMCAVSPALILYATNARGHAMVALGFLVLVLAGLLLRREPDRPAAWIALVVTGALGAYAVPIFLYPAGGVYVWLTLESLRGEESLPELGKLATAAGLTVLLTVGLYSPVIVAEGLPALLANSVVEPRAPRVFLSALPSFFADLGHEWTTGLPTTVVAVAVLGFLAGLLSLLQRQRRWLAVGVVGWALMLILLTRRAEYARIWLYLLPLVALMSGNGVSRILGWAAERAGGRPGARRRVAFGTVLLLLLLCTGGWVLARDSVERMTATGSLPHGDAVAAWLAGRVGPGDGVRATLPGTVPLAYYFARRDDITPRVLRRSASGSMYLIVNEANGQTIASVLAEMGVSEAYAHRAVRVFDRPWVAVYQLGG